MKTSLKVAAVALVVIIVAVGVVAIIGSGNSSSGDVELNYAYEDQLILDKSGSGSMTPEDGMVYCVVSYTVENNTSHDVDYWTSDVSLRIGNLSYGPEILYAHNDGGWIIESGAVHQGVYAFEVPEGHGEVTFSLGLDETMDSTLSVAAIPEREAGQVYGMIYYDIGEPFLDTLTVSLILRNVSYETTISNNPNYFHLTDGNGALNYSWDSFSVPGNDFDQEIPPGERSEQFYLVFDLPTGWDDGRDLYLTWDGYPERGMILTTDLTEILAA